MRFIRVAVPVPIDDTFVYEFPENEEPEPGLRVLVPFGRRQLWGTIVGEERERPARAIRPIVGIPEPRLTLTPELIELCRWVAEYYAAPLGEVLVRMPILEFCPHMRRHIPPHRERCRTSCSHWPPALFQPKPMMQDLLQPHSGADRRW